MLTILYDAYLGLHDYKNPAFRSAILLSFEKSLYSEQEIENKTDEIAEKRSQLHRFLMVLQLFLFPEPTLFFFVLTICCVPFLTVPHYTIIPSYTIIDFLRFFHLILLFHTIPLLIFIDLSTLYHYFAPYYYLGLQSKTMGLTSGIDGPLTRRP